MSMWDEPFQRTTYEDESLRRRFYQVKLAAGVSVFQDQWSIADLDAAADLMEKAGGHLHLILGESELWCSDSFVAQLGSDSANVLSTNWEWLEDIRKLTERPEPPPEVHGKIAVLTQEDGRISISVLRVQHSVLNRNNYTKKVLRDYDHVLGEIRNPDPCGRLVLMNGSPGTGKTHLVQGLIADSPGVYFILVPTHLVADLSGPALLNALVEFDNGDGDNLVLVLEDADICLAARGAGNMSGIASLLNMSDGILGKALKLRILATTNAETIQLDEALLRPGRLCRHIHVDKLSGSDLANTLSTHGVKSDGTGTMSLAEVYQVVREHAKARAAQPEEAQGSPVADLQ